jgi:hypothetical protein
MNEALSVTLDMSSVITETETLISYGQRQNIGNMSLFDDVKH